MPGLMPMWCPGGRGNGPIVLLCGGIWCLGGKGMSYKNGEYIYISDISFTVVLFIVLECMMITNQIHFNMKHEVRIMTYMHSVADQFGQCLLGASAAWSAGAGARLVHL